MVSQESNPAVNACEEMYFWGRGLTLEKTFARRFQKFFSLGREQEERGKAVHCLYSLTLANRSS